MENEIGECKLHFNCCDTCDNYSESTSCIAGLDISPGAMEVSQSDQNKIICTAWRKKE